MATTTSLPSDPGPFSAIFNYEEELKKEQEKKKQLQQSQQKIMRTNALGDAFRLLIDGVGGSMGSTITQKPVNPGILKAVDRYHTLDKEYENRLDRVKLQDLAFREKNMQYNLGLEAEQRGIGKQIEAEKRAEGRQIAGEQRAITRQDELYKRAKEDKALDAENEFNMFVKKTGVQTDAQIRTMKEKSKIDQEALTRQVPRNMMRTKADVPFVIPGTHETIYIRPEEIQEMQYQLTKDKQKYDPELDKALKALLNNETVRDEATINVLKKNWDKVKSVLPEYANEASINQQLTDSKNEQDTKVMQVRIYNTLSNTSLNDRKRKKLVVKAVKLQYPSLDDDEAEEMANKYIGMYQAQLSNPNK